MILRHAGIDMTPKLRNNGLGTRRHDLIQGLFEAFVPLPIFRSFPSSLISDPLGKPDFLFPHELEKTCVLISVKVAQELGIRLEYRGKGSAPSTPRSKLPDELPQHHNAIGRPLKQQKRQLGPLRW